MALSPDSSAALIRPRVCALRRAISSADSIAAAKSEFCIIVAIEILVPKTSVYRTALQVCSVLCIEALTGGNRNGFLERVDSGQVARLCFQIGVEFVISDSYLRRRLWFIVPVVLQYKVVSSNPHPVLAQRAVQWPSF